MVAKPSEAATFAFLDCSAKIGIITNGTLAQIDSFILKK